MLKLYIRQDLRMPLGKQIAQATHACGSFILGCFDFERLEWKATDSDTLRELVLNLKINHVESEDQLMNHPIIITDLGHTVFKGVPTKTVSLDVNTELLQKLKFVENPHVNTTRDIRMVMVVNKTYMRSINKPIFIEDAIKVFTNHIISTLENYKNGMLNLNDIENLKHWVTGSFAKITLVTDEPSILLAADKIKNMKLEHLIATVVTNNMSSYLVISPQTKEWCQDITGSFKML